MKRFQLKTLLAYGLCGLLIGCAADFPAPVSGLQKDYRDINRGSYRGSYYEVKRGDTLYFIAYVTDKDVNDIIRFNRLEAPYTIHPGQKLRLWSPIYNTPAYGGTGAGNSSSIAANKSAPPRISSTPSSVAPKPSSATPSAATSSNVALPKPSAATTAASTAAVAKTPVSVATSVPVSPPKPSKNTNAAQANKSTNLVKKDPVKTIDQSKTKEYVGSDHQQNINKTVSKPTPQNDKVDKWLWPTKGRVVKNFSAGDQGNKGIDIAGQRGQSITSTAAGTVVYSGNALRGYGNLIIVKHNEHYLSAYAHNDQLLVKEGQSVRAGQKIATMGSSGTNSVRLHFEIRYQGKSVNPKRYLP
uniref:Peptidoglycan DD-metalloendopeptidase family protein n=1 Tax=Vibrio ziniensis TaxID=2711221 RepID=A0A6G7CKY4_9VIBR|nr:peptidoglycan DD-metalloendopeptidase family protein [Vibrio ziniensis]QIH42708.1 peptidoglycan DD-metalloendopeptidase family protein [Vibrio ziniensis]